MKYVLIFTALFLTSCVTQKIVPIEERQVQVVHEVNLTKNQIFDKTLEWVAVTFTDSNVVIEIKDRDGGKIVGKGVTDYTNVNVPWAPYYCSFTFIIDIKDKKYRVMYNNFVDSYYIIQSVSEVDSVKKNIINLDKSLNSFLLRVNNDTW